MWMRGVKERRGGQSRKALGFGTGATGRTKVVIYSATDDGGAGPKAAEERVLDTRTWRCL